MHERRPGHAAKDRLPRRIRRIEGIDAAFPSAQAPGSVLAARIGSDYDIAAAREIR
jgi:hypothetical protein